MGTAGVKGWDVDKEQGSLAITGLETCPSTGRK